MFGFGLRTAELELLLLLLLLEPPPPIGRRGTLGGEEATLADEESS